MFSRSITSTIADEPHSTPLIRDFAENIAVPHLVRLKQLCHAAAVKIPHQIDCHCEEGVVDTKSPGRCHHLLEIRGVWQDLVDEDEDGEYMEYADEAWWAEASDFAVNPGVELCGSDESLDLNVGSMAEYDVCLYFSL
jgi:hypothetical protein